MEIMQEIALPVLALMSWIGLLSYPALSDGWVRENDVNKLYLKGVKCRTKLIDNHWIHIYTSNLHSNTYLVKCVNAGCNCTFKYCDTLQECKDYAENRHKEE
jgi:hypothetical protein